MLIWYIACGTLAVCFVIATILFAISNRQNNASLTIIENMQKSRNIVDSNIKYKCIFNETEEGSYYEIIDSNNQILGKSRVFSTKSTCMNNAAKLQERFKLDIITDEASLMFGKYSVMLENNEDKYRFKIMSLNNLSFVSRYYNTAEELFNDMEKYKAVSKNEYVFVM